MTYYMGKEYIHSGLFGQQCEDINYLKRLQTFLNLKKTFINVYTRLDYGFAEVGGVSLSDGNEYK